MNNTLTHRAITSSRRLFQPTLVQRLGIIIIPTVISISSFALIALRCSDLFWLFTPSSLPKEPVNASKKQQNEDNRSNNDEDFLPEG